MDTTKASDGCYSQACSRSLAPTRPSSSSSLQQSSHSLQAEHTTVSDRARPTQTFKVTANITLNVLGARHRYLGAHLPNMPPADVFENRLERGYDGASSPPVRSFIAYGTSSANAAVGTSNDVKHNDARRAAAAAGYATSANSGAIPNGAIVALLPAANEDDYDMREVAEWRSQENRVYPNHFCAWNCCYTLPPEVSDHRTWRSNARQANASLKQRRGPSLRLQFQSPLHTAQIDHLPVCHERCWQAELARLMRESGGKVDCASLPLCHRTCYLQKIFREQHDGSFKEVVPWARSLKERCRWHKFQHWATREIASHGGC
ncbi:hypothetical protein BAUCODRAFT_261825 [Baudoinia panamericana UAMH 10762]|uniref:Uncharacterized protein n=1 Tax=Baudoinia panamericana (strain UAMH 10762) TaxID=717646 RepID=M2M8N8_BAUPA|nr:uncharacterized protein BAUCODRAFT_261825 [Baudoinia panamericana UAMH 10762]EMC92766.1 hypothetical protein BAUCODRAFT_261825 [Baudoinia panamericana UAMH 10762]